MALLIRREGKYAMIDFAKLKRETLIGTTILCSLMSGKSSYAMNPKDYAEAGSDLEVIRTNCSAGERANLEKDGWSLPKLLSLAKPAGVGDGRLERRCAALERHLSEETAHNADLTLLLAEAHQANITEYATACDRDDAALASLIVKNTKAFGTNPPPRDVEGLLATVAHLLANEVCWLNSCSNTTGTRGPQAVKPVRTSTVGARSGRIREEVVSRMVPGQDALMNLVRGDRRPSSFLKYKQF